MLPNGYSLLAQNYARQKRLSEVLPLIEKLLECPVHEEESDSIVDGVKCARDVLIKLGRAKEISSIVQRAKSKYPKLEKRLEEVGPNCL